MYGLPPEADLSFFHGRTLLQVCIGAHDLSLNFDGDVSVTVESCIGLAEKGGALHRYEDFRQAVSALVPLLDKAVVSAEGSRDGTLSLEYEGGGHLEIHDNSKEYESYTIKHGGQLIVV